MAKNGTFSNTIGGIKVNAPLDWKNIRISCTFEDENIQANISTTQLTFTLQAREVIRNHVANNGVFTKLPIVINVSNNVNSYDIFDGYIDLTEGYLDDENNGRVTVTIKKSEGLNDLSDQVAPLSFLYLEELGVITKNDYTDFDYKVEKKINLIEQLMNEIILLMMIKEFNESIADTSKVVTDASAFIAGGGLTGPLGATISTLGKVSITAAYNVVMVNAILKLGLNMVNTFIPPKRTTKGIKYHTALERVFSHLGFTFVTDITDLQEMYYLPPNKRLDDIDTFGYLKKTRGTDKGIAESSEVYGYWVKDFIDLVKKKFNAKIYLENGVVYLYNEYSNFWQKKSTWVQPSIQSPAVGFNTDEFYKAREVKFLTDDSNEWTLENYKGTTYTITTEGGELMKNFDVIDIPMSLSVRKDSLNPLELLVLTTAQTLDRIANNLGGDSNLESKVKLNVNVLKFSSNNWQNPYLLRKKGSRILSRDEMSAKYFYDKYIYGKSFVLNNFYGQKYVYNDVEVPFGFEDFLKVINNGYFVTAQKEEGKIISFDWTIGSDRATHSYYIRKPYVTNITERYLEVI